METQPPLDAPPTGLRRWAPRSFRGSIVASTVALMTIAMVVVVLGIQVVLEWTAQRDVQQVLEERSRAVVSVLAQSEDSPLAVPEDALQPGMVVYDASGQQVAGSVATAVRDTADDLATTARVRVVRGAEDEDRLLATPFTTESGERGVLVVSQETAPYERSELYALLAAAVLGVLVVAATALMALRVTAQALKPVTVMAERAADWSEHDLSHRFDLGPPTNELAALGETLDHLLDRVASVIRSEQRLTSELAHELRTPLTGIQGSADLALLRGVDDPAVREDLRQIAASSREMAGVITTLLDLARDARATSREQECRLADVVPALLAGTPAGPVEVVDRTDASTARIATPAGLVARVLAPLVDNASRHARSRVVLDATDLPDRVEVVVRDDGPGVDEAVRATLFEPGVSTRSDGAGLGLGIARRVATSFGGEVTLDEPAGTSGGAAFRVRLPRR
jgi:two-component system, OmpR family, sensor kinase